MLSFMLLAIATFVLVICLAPVIGIWAVIVCDVTICVAIITRIITRLVIGKRKGS